jgi:POT family proton-dependent oligopeptide transporter
MKQPKAFYLLACVQMWKFFSNFGMRTLLVLYMVEALRMSDAHAFGINAVFLGVVELSGIFGGIVADRVLGLRRATQLGAFLITFGYCGFIFEKGLHFALPLVVLGASLFSGNITALLGEAYAADDPRRERGFTFFYMLQNLGALISTFLCGMIANIFGYKAGFSVAASGMAIGCLILFMGRHLIKGMGEAPARQKSLWVIPSLGAILVLSALAIHYEELTLPLLPWATALVFCIFASKLLKTQELGRQKVRTLLIYLGAMILFFAGEDQICSSLVVFSEREVDRMLWGWTFPSSLLMSANPIIILTFGALVAKVRFRLAAPFLLVALSFGSLALVCFKEISFSIFGIMGLVGVISLAELMIGPVVYSFASEVAAKGKAGMVMGMLPIAFSLAFLLSGAFSKMVAISEAATSLHTYGSGFAKIAVIVLVGGLLLEILMKRYADAKRTVY